MTTTTAQTAAVLDEMVAGIMGVKANKAVKLTPVGTETAKLPADVPGVFMAQEGLQDVATDLRRQAALLLDVADGIDVILGKSTAVADNAAKVAATEKVLQEREADRRAADRVAAEAGDKRAAQRVDESEAFDARLASLSAQAQAATFSAAALDADDEDGDDGWLCPLHGSEDVRTRTSPKGREYAVCAVPNCKEFERK